VCLAFFHDGKKQKRGKDFCFLLKQAFEFIKTYHQEEYVKTNVTKIIIGFRILSQVKSLILILRRKNLKKSDQSF
jgi:hypothetical protein